MSIPIAARRYISDIGLTSWKWVDNRDDHAGDDYVHAILVITNQQKGKNEMFSTVFGWGCPDNWMETDDLGWHGPVRGVVCWSEIKT